MCNPQNFRIIGASTLLCLAIYSLIGLISNYYELNNNSHAFIGTWPLNPRPAIGIFVVIQVSNLLGVIMGVLGLSRKSLLVIYCASFILILNVVILIVFGGVCIRESFNDPSHQLFQELKGHWNESSYLSWILDYQWEHGCCGVHSYMDWKVLGMSGVPGGSAPYSCCTRGQGVPPPSCGEGALTSSKSQDDLAATIILKGCGGYVSKDHGSTLWFLGLEMLSQAGLLFILTAFIYIGATRTIYHPLMMAHDDLAHHGGEGGGGGDLIGEGDDEEGHHDLSSSGRAQSGSGSRTCSLNPHLLNHNEGNGGHHGGPSRTSFSRFRSRGPIRNGRARISIPGPSSAIQHNRPLGLDRGQGQGQREYLSRGNETGGSILPISSDTNFNGPSIGPPGQFGRGPTYYRDALQRKCTSRTTFLNNLEMLLQPTNTKSTQSTTPQPSSSQNFAGVSASEAHLLGNFGRTSNSAGPGGGSKHGQGHHSNQSTLSHYSSLPHVSGLTLLQGFYNSYGYQGISPKGARITGGPTLTPTQSSQTHQHKHLFGGLFSNPFSSSKSVHKTKDKDENPQGQSQCQGSNPSILPPSTSNPCFLNNNNNSSSAVTLCGNKSTKLFTLPLDPNLDTIHEDKIAEAVGEGGEVEDGSDGSRTARVVTFSTSVRDMENLDLVKQLEEDSEVSVNANVLVSPPPEGDNLRLHENSKDDEIVAQGSGSGYSTPPESHENGSFSSGSVLGLQDGSKVNPVEEEETRELKSPTSTSEFMSSLPLSVPVQGSPSSSCLTVSNV